MGYNRIAWGGGYWDNSLAGINTPSSANAAQLQSAADSFTRKWLGQMQRGISLYENANRSIGQLDDVYGDLDAEFDEYDARWSPIRDELIAAGGDDLDRRNQLAAQYMELARPDYEGEAGRAMAGVAHQADIAKGEIGRDMSRRGINLGSGQYAEMMRKSALDEAKAKVLAAGQARQGEKGRVAAMAGKGIQLFNPQNTAGVAQGIDLGRQNLLTAKGNVAKNKAGLQTSLATNYNQNITKPLGSAAGSYQGLSLGMASRNRGGGGIRKTTYNGVSSSNPNALSSAIRKPINPSVKWTSNVFPED